MESNEPSQTDIIEAHLNLLLDSYEDVDVVYALWRIINFKYPFLRLVRADDLSTLHVDLNNVASQLNGAVQTIMGSDGYGHSMIDRMMTLKTATERASLCINNALTMLSSLPTRRLM